MRHLISNFFKKDNNSAVGFFPDFNWISSIVLPLWHLRIREGTSVNIINRLLLRKKEEYNFTLLSNTAIHANQLFVTKESKEYEIENIS